MAKTVKTKYILRLPGPSGTRDAQAGEDYGRYTAEIKVGRKVTQQHFGSFVGAYQWLRGQKPALQPAEVIYVSAVPKKIRWGSEAYDTVVSVA